MQRRRQKPEEISKNIFSFNEKEKKKKRKIKVRQKEEFQKEPTKTFVLKEKMKKIAKRGNLFFSKQFNQVERVRNISWVNFQEVEEDKTGDEKGEMND